jgi:hypothetical protein
MYRSRGERVEDEHEAGVTRLSIRYEVDKRIIVDLFPVDLRRKL